jgi:hypothetical protein
MSQETKLTQRRVVTIDHKGRQAVGEKVKMVAMEVAVTATGYAMSQGLRIHTSGGSQGSTTVG